MTVIALCDPDDVKELRDSIISRLRDCISDIATLSDSSDFGSGLRLSVAMECIESAIGYIEKNGRRGIHDYR